MKLVPSSALVIEWKDKEYELRKPRVKETMQFSKAYAEVDQSNTIEVLELTISYLDNLGLPKKVSEEMEMDHITQISNAFNKVEDAGK